MKKCFQVLILVALIAILGIAVFWATGETLYDCELRLSSDKDAYQVGDAVVLIAQIIPKKERSLTLSRALYQSLTLWNVQDQNPRRFDRDEKVRYQLGPDDPLRFEIKGRIVTDGGGNIWADFGDFGKGQIKNGLFPELRFSALPYKINRSDSADWGPSNSLQLRLQE